MEYLLYIIYYIDTNELSIEDNFTHENKQKI